MKLENIAHSLGSIEISNSKILDSGTNNKDKNIELLNKLGIDSRYKCSESEDVKSLAISAFSKLCSKQQISPDFLIGVTQTSLNCFPHMSAFIEGSNLKNNIGSFDINLGCSGFVYALIVLESMMAREICYNPVIICADSYNKFLTEPKNSAYLLFSDAAIAVSFSNDKSIKILSSDLGTDGTGADKLILEKNVEMLDQEIYMDGSAVYLFTMSKVIISVNKVLSDAKLNVDDVDLFLFHQASGMVLDSLQKKLNIPTKKMPRNLDQIGNTVSCTIPFLLEALQKSNDLHTGQKILLSGFGVGLSWATCIIEI